MNKPYKQTKPPADDFRTTYLSSRGAQILGQHALSLPVGHPVRETTKLLLERWAEGSTVLFTDEPLAADDDSTFEGLGEVMEQAA